MTNGEPEIPPYRPVEVPPEDFPVDIPPGGPIEEPAPLPEVSPQPPVELPGAKNRVAPEAASLEGGKDK